MLRKKGRCKYGDRRGLREGVRRQHDLYPFLKRPVNKSEVLVIDDGRDGRDFTVPSSSPSNFRGR